MSTFSFPVRDLFVSTGYATETTAATFISTASVGEVVALNKNGQTAPVTGEDTYLLIKDSKGIVKSSDTLKWGNVKKVTKVDPTTVVPAYATFPITAAAVSALTAGDTYKGLLRIPNYGSQSPNDELLVPFAYATDSSKTVDTVAEGLILSLSRNLARAEGITGKFVNFKTGYKFIFDTEAHVITDKAGLTNGDIIWVISNGKAWTVADKTASTFATICTTEKTWATELGNGTAEYVDSNPWFNFLKLDGSDVTIYIVSKEQSATDNKLEGYPIVFYAGLEVLDATSWDVNSTVTVTNVGRVGSAGEGKNIRRLETFAKGHTGDFYRGVGFPNNFDNYYDASTTTNYYLVNIEFYHEGNDVNVLATGKQQKVLQVALSTSAAAVSLKAALDSWLFPDIALGQLSNVVTTGATNGQQLTFVEATGTWEPATA
jgi:hypothetical protein